MAYKMLAFSWWKELIKATLPTIMKILGNLLKEDTKKDEEKPKDQ